MRTTAMAAGGRPEDSAKIVSPGCGMGGISSDCRAGGKRSYMRGGPLSQGRVRMVEKPNPSAENRLARETSPYLLQHKNNPVEWWPWGPDALAEAKRANKPILLSVGYAACHWCHVMAHESFEDDETARVMNNLFVNIKVDREERPDIDQIYMSALHLLGEQGGWPLTMFLTPAGEPVWGGTYFPKTARYGRPAFVDVLREVARLFREEPGQIERNRSALMQRLGEQARPQRRTIIGLPELDN